MDAEKIKFLIQSIEVLIDELKAEVYTDAETHRISETEYSEEGEGKPTEELIMDMFDHITDDSVWDPLKQKTYYNLTLYKR